MHKKSKKIIIVMAIVALLALSLPSCKSDSDSFKEQDYVGTWGATTIVDGDKMYEFHSRYNSIPVYVLMLN